ncbi:conserved domain protein [Symbiobacterium thermophilum IAM 14863]|uniref:Protein translocase subunit SecE n=2 Tax=Symbiobacterium thermophilum TaxID=2734 RepID=Q67JS6_SYMTH|nr:conserved domain protein [Symbiobacterium thermophilum IAM 14863]
MTGTAVQRFPEAGDDRRKLCPRALQPVRGRATICTLVALPGFICVGAFSISRVVVIMERIKAFFEGIRTYLREVVGELRKVVWPSRERVIKATGIVVAMVALVAGFLYLWDLGIGALMELLLA